MRVDALVTFIYIYVTIPSDVTLQTRNQRGTVMTVYHTAIRTGKEELWPLTSLLLLPTTITT